MAFTKIHKYALIGMDNLVNIGIPYYTVNSKMHETMCLWFPTVCGEQEDYLKHSRFSINVS